MKSSTALRIAQAIQIMKLDGFESYSLSQISRASGVATKTLQRNKDLITILDFILDIKGYYRCIL